MARPQQQLQFPPFGKMSKILLFVLVGIFVAQLAMNIAFGFDAARVDNVMSWVLYQRDTFNAGRVWTPLTYFWCQSLNGIFGIVGTGLMLYFFGGAVEEKMGQRRMVVLFVVAGAASGLVLHLFNVLMSSVLPMQTAMAAVGASAPTSALLGAFCWYHWSSDLHLIVISFKGKHLVYFSVVLSAVSVGLGDISGAVLSLVGLGIGILAASGLWRPRRLMLRFNLWRTERQLKLIEGGKTTVSVKKKREYLH